MWGTRYKLFAKEIQGKFMGIRQGNIGYVTRKRRTTSFIHYSRDPNIAIAKKHPATITPDLYWPVTRAPHDLISKVPSLPPNYTVFN